MLYKVLFLKTHKIWDRYQGFQGNFYYPHELYRIEDTQELPYKSCAYFTISKMSIYGIYYFYPHEVKYYLDIEDRQHATPMFPCVHSLQEPKIHVKHNNEKSVHFLLAMANRKAPK